MTKESMQQKFKKWHLTDEIRTEHHESEFTQFRPQMFGILNDYEIPYFDDLEDANFYAVFWYSAFLRAMSEINQQWEKIIVSATVQDGSPTGEHE